MRRLMIVEANEMPRRVLDWWVDANPSSALAELLAGGTVTETVLDEELPRDLYPSQSWASVGMGMPWTDHGVFWYGDPKPSEFPFYWQAAAEAGHSVGLIGVLHTSPIEVQCGHPNFSFVLPDVFGEEHGALPADLTSLQELNMRLSRESARVASLRPSLSDARGALSFARHGVRPSTWTSLAELGAKVAAGKWNKERLRVGQTMLMADVFEKQVDVFEPDLAVLFCNHIASAMHRYWAATFPGDWDEHPYGDEWVADHHGELPFAMQALDDVVGRLLRVAERTDRTLIITTSMGQQPDLTVDSSVTEQAVIRDGRAFLRACGIEAELEQRGAMVPQLTLGSSDSATLAEAESALRSVLGSAASSLMLKGDALTLTYDLPCRDGRVEIGRRLVDPASAGITIEKISDHRSGRHHPRGLMVSNRTEGWPAEVNALQVAPTLLEILGVAPLAHHGAAAETTSRV